MYSKYGNIKQMNSNHYLCLKVSLLIIFVMNDIIYTILQIYICTYYLNARLYQQYQLIGHKIFL